MIKAKTALPCIKTHLFIVGRGKEETMKKKEEVMKAVLFILAISVICGFGRVTTAAESQPSKVRDNLDGTLTDTTTGLMWIRDYKEAAKNIKEARTICAELQYAGHKDWRLPTSVELSRFVKYLRSSKPAVDFVVLKETDKGALYWTSSEHIQDPKKQGGLVMKSDSPLVQTVNSEGSVIIHGGAESWHDFVIPVRGPIK